jgi:hypothetical protein
MSGRLAWIALFLSLAGTALAAKPLITSRDIVNESLTGRDVRDGSLRRAQLDMATLRGPSGSSGPAGPPGPDAPPGPPGARYRYAYVEGDGSHEGYPSVSVTVSAPGTYCLTVPDSARWVQVTGRDLETARRTSAQLYADGAPRDPCPADAAIRVDVSPGPGPFLLVWGPA